MTWWIDAAAGVNGDGSELSPFNSWANFLAGAAGDLTGLGEVEVFIKGTLTDPNVTGFSYTLAGFTNESASNFLHFKPWPGFEGDGSIGSMPGWQAGTSGSGAQYVNFVNFHRISHLRLRVTGTGAMDAFRFDNAVYTGVMVEAEGIALRTSFRFHTATVRACLSLSATPTMSAFFTSAPSTAIECDNCTAFNSDGTGGTAFDFTTNATGNALMKNNAVFGFTTEYDGTFTNANSTNNAGELAAASQPANIQTNYVQLLADPFADSANDDYSPAAGGALDGAGVAITGFTEDAGGNAWASPPSIGYLEVAAVSGSGTPQAQPATVEGTGEVSQFGAGTPAAQASTVDGAGTVTRASVTVSLTGANQLRDINQDPYLSLAGIRWEWYDDPADTQGAPVDFGTFATDASGNATVTIEGSALSNGQFGQLLVYHPTDNLIRGIYRLPVVV